MTDGAQEGDFATRLTRAIKASGLTLDALRQELQGHDIQVSVATLSYWQNGRSQPTRAHSRRILSALEKVLGLQDGDLTTWAPVANTRSRGSIASRSGLELPQTVEQALELSGMTARTLRKVSAQVTVTIAEDRTQSNEVVRNVVQCLVPGTSSFPVVVESFEDVGQEVHGLSNCTAGRVWPLANQGLVLTEMLLPRPLRQGELMMLEYMTTIEAGSDVSDAIQIAQGRLSELVVEVQFAPGAVPERVVGYTRSLDDDPGLDAPDAVDLPISEGCAQFVRLDTPPGISVVRWQWGDA